MWLRAWRVRGLLDLIDQLGPRSRFRTALVNDPEYAAAVVQEHEAARTLTDDPNSWTPDYAEYDLHAAQLHDLRQLVVQLIDTIRAVYQQNPSGVPPFPSPVTEIDRAREELRAQLYQQSQRIFSPGADLP